MNDKLVLIDTSVWIDFFRGITPAISEIVDGLLAEDRAGICGIVVAELIQGAKSEKEVVELAEAGQAIKHLTEAPDLWERAGRLAYKLRRKGATTHIVDCYLAVLAADNLSPLLTLDKHFSVICDVLPLSLVKVSL